MSNSNGTARFNIANNDLPTEIEISYLGVKPLLFPVKEAGNYTVKFALNPQEFIMPLEKGNQLHFVVNKIKSNEIFLREEKHETKFYKYNRRQ